MFAPCASTRWSTLSPEALAAAGVAFDGLETTGARRGRTTGGAGRHITSQRTLHMKYDGTDTTLEIAMAFTTAPVVAEFERRYAQQYGFLMPGKSLVIEAIAVEAIGRTQSAATFRPYSRRVPDRCVR